MIKLKLIFALIINKYVSWSCNVNAKLIKIQGNILEEVRKVMPTEQQEVQENG